jgi:hypothetical protein
MPSPVQLLGHTLHYYCLHNCHSSLPRPIWTLSIYPHPMPCNTALTKTSLYNSRGIGATSGDHCDKMHRRLLKTAEGAKIVDGCVLRVQQQRVQSSNCSVTLHIGRTTS